MATQWEPPAPTRLDPVQSAKSARLLVVPVLVGCLVSLTLGIYGRLHSPTGVAVDVIGFSNGGTVKSVLATGAVVFAIVQVFTSLVMYGKIRLAGSPSWISGLHRWSGRIAFILTIPVVVHCVYALGFQTFSVRVLVHSIAGCLFFGVFTVKMLSLTRRGTPGWVLPVFGGLAFALLVLIWFTSAFWFFTTFGWSR
jgi:uncharacterized protein DUF6529